MAQQYRDLLNPDPKVHGPAEDWMLVNEPQHWSMTHTSLVPTIMTTGFRYNVIPSEAKATIDVRLHPDEDQDDVPRPGAQGRSTTRRSKCAGRAIATGRPAARG